MGFPLLVRWHLYFESGPCLFWKHNCRIHCSYVYVIHTIHDMILKYVFCVDLSRIYAGLWWPSMEMLSALLVICEENHRSLVDSYHKGPMLLAALWCFLCVMLNKLFSKQSSCWWFEIGLILSTANASHSPTYYEILFYNYIVSPPCGIQFS